MFYPNRGDCAASKDQERGGLCDSEELAASLGCWVERWTVVEWPPPVATCLHFLVGS